MLHSKQKFQFFISSTFGEMSDYRSEAANRIVMDGHLPIRLEFHPSHGISTVNYIERTISESQVFFMIIGNEHGSFIDGDVRTYLDLEFDIARNLLAEGGIAIAVIIIDDHTVNQARDNTNKNDNIDDRTDYLKQFINFVDQNSNPDNGIFSYRVPAAEFSAQVGICVRDCTEFLDKKFVPGLVRGGSTPAKRRYQSGVENEFLVEIVDAIQNFEKLYERCSVNAELKADVAEFFAQEYGPEIDQNNTRLFFESGSTIAYVARELETKMKFHEVSGEYFTNNVLVHLRGRVARGLRCQWLPHGFADNNDAYGASYGPISDITPMPPNFPLRFREKEIGYLNKVSTALKTAMSSKSGSLLLAAASGLQISDNIRLKAGNTENAVIENVMKCRGPHVGSFHNKLFKKSMYEANIPTILFLDETKIDTEIDPDRCHFIFDGQESDGELTWEFVLQNHPLAFCVSCEGFEERSVKLLENKNFKINKIPNSKRLRFMAMNESFMAQTEYLDHRITAEAK